MARIVRRQCLDVLVSAVLHMLLKLCIPGIPTNSKRRWSGDAKRFTIHLEPQIVEQPRSGTIVDGHLGKLTLIKLSLDIAEIQSTDVVIFKTCGEDGLVHVLLEVLHECCLFFRSHFVQLALGIQIVLLELT